MALSNATRVQCSELLAQLLFDGLLNQGRGEQALTWGERRMIAPAYQGGVTLFAGQFEGWLAN